MDRLINSTQGAYSALSIATTIPRASVTGAIFGPIQTTPITLTTGTPSISAALSSATNATSTTVEAAGPATSIVLSPRPNNPLGHFNPYIVDSLKHCGFAFPAVTAEVLHPFADFHQVFFRKLQ